MLNLYDQDKTITIAPYTTVMEIVPKQDRSRIYGIIINGKLHDLNYQIKESGKMQFIYADSDDGKLIYERSLSFLFIAAVKSLYEHTRVRIEYSFSNGLYCEIEGSTLALYDRDKIYQKMLDLVAQKEVIYRRIVSKEEAVFYFETIHMQDKADLLRYRKNQVCSIYRLCNFDDYFYGIMLPDTSYITHFSLRSHHDGFWLSPQSEFIDQPHFFQTFKRFETYWRLQDLATVSKLNKKIIDGNMKEVVDLSENMIQHEYGELVHQIMHSSKEVRLILIAGPSSAGKTTFSRRLALELGREGISTMAISMDDYYCNREETPRLPDGSYDFENIACVDLDLFNSQMKALANQEEVLLPKFNFKTGKREWTNKKIRLCNQQILIVEGIHGLNPLTSASISPHHKFKIYINDLNTLNFDHHNRIPTSDYRLIRRMVRDHQFRGYSAADTISAWSKVKEGEIKYIYPYQEEADYIFNTSMIYELSILKRIALPLLEEITPDQKEYPQANRLKKLLAYIVDGVETYIPADSILREFIGHSMFF